MPPILDCQIKSAYLSKAACSAGCFACLAPPRSFLSNYFTEAESRVSFWKVTLVNSISRSSVWAARDETQGLTPARQVLYHEIQAFVNICLNIFLCLIVCMCMCVCHHVDMSMCECRWARRPEEAIRSLEVGVTVVHATNQTCVSFKSSTHLWLLSHLSSPILYEFSSLACNSCP